MYDFLMQLRDELAPRYYMAYETLPASEKEVCKKRLTSICEDFKEFHRTAFSEGLLALEDAAIEKFGHKFLKLAHIGRTQGFCFRILCHRDSAACEKRGVCVHD